MNNQLQPPQILGTWVDDITIVGEYTRMELNATHLANHWRRNSLSSDYWASYTAQSITISPDHLPKQAIQDILSYLLNELFENCAKFSGGSILDACYQSWMQEETMIFQLTNHIHPEQQAPSSIPFKKYLQATQMSFFSKS